MPGFVDSDRLLLFGKEGIGGISSSQDYPVPRLVDVLGKDVVAVVTDRDDCPTPWAVCPGCSGASSGRRTPGVSDWTATNCSTRSEVLKIASRARIAGYSCEHPCATRWREGHPVPRCRCAFLSRFLFGVAQNGTGHVPIEPSRLAHSPRKVANAPREMPDGPR